MNGRIAALEMAEQIISLLRQIDRGDYCRPLPLFNDATLGQHFRHIFDFYQCFVKGLSECELNYASRERNPLIEKDPVFASEAFRSLLPELENLDENKKMLVKSHVESAGLSNGFSQFHSSVGRELMFIHDHAIHHLAIIKIGWKWLSPQTSLDENLGVAPSTLAFRKGRQAPTD